MALSFRLPKLRMSSAGWGGAAGAVAAHPVEANEALTGLGDYPLFAGAGWQAGHRVKPGRQAGQLHAGRMPADRLGQCWWR